jgi:anti-sigma regulatory factor (Ser/Thr protein kinase)
MDKMSAARSNMPVSIVIGNNIAEMAKVVAFVERFGTTHRIPQPIINDLNVCLDELLNNTVSYGYADKEPHEIIVSLSLVDGVLTAELRDDAMPFDPNQPVVVALSANLKSRTIGGLGLHFVRSLMDEVGYRRVGRYNVTKLKKGVRQGAADGNC